MSCFLFQNSILGNDPLGKNKTIVNPCEKSMNVITFKSLCCVWVALWRQSSWDWGLAALGLQEVQGLHGWLCRVAGENMCQCIRLKHNQKQSECAVWAQACAGSGCYSSVHVSTAQLRHSHTAKVKSAGRRGHRVNNSSKQLTQLSRLVALPLILCTR